jgi:hypothetical protein
MEVEPGEGSSSAAPGLWQPLSARLGGQAIDQTWQEGIPAWINRAVRDWLSMQLHDMTVRDRLFARLHYHDIGDGWGYSPPVDTLSEADLLNWIDGVLHIQAARSVGRIARHQVDDLEVILRDGNSIWKVADSSDALERRQDATVTAAAHTASQTARSIGRLASAAAGSSPGRARWARWRSRTSGVLGVISSATFARSRNS